MFQKIRERINLFIAKSPKKAVLLGIMIFNVLFTLLSALIIIILFKHVNGLAQYTFGEAVYHAFLMILDPGGLEGFIPDVGKAGTFTVIFCILIVFVGMIFFSGAIIGYVTTSISEFIESKNNGKNKLMISNHLVIVNWNERGPEIINEFLQENEEIKVVVLVPDGKEKIDEEIRNRLDMTLIQKTEEVFKAAEKMPFLKKRIYIGKNLPKDCITYIVREGDVASANDLDDICISKAKNVIILDSMSGEEKAIAEGNTTILKTLILISEASKANEKQQILVEVSNQWTRDLVGRIIAFKGAEMKGSIIPVSSNMLLGYIYSQMTLIPELYDEYEAFLANNIEAGKKEYHYRKRNVVILGHNSILEPLLEGIGKYSQDAEFMRDEKLGRIVVVDDEKTLKEQENYQAYPYVETLAADVFDENIINQRLLELSQNAVEETTLLILSDDSTNIEDVDANVLTYLIYIQEEICRREKCEPAFKREQLDVIVEILNPKNKEIVESYGVDKVIIGNSYVSHMISLLCRDKAPSLSLEDGTLE